MAKNADKKRLEANAKRLLKLKILIGTSITAFILLRLTLREHTRWHVIGLLLAGGSALLAYTAVDSALTPHYSASGELLFGGADLDTGGLLGYYHDLIFLTTGTLILGSCWDVAWWVLLSIPAYALSKVFTLFVLPRLTPIGTNDD